MSQLASRPAMDSSTPSQSLSQLAPQLVKMPIEVIHRIAYFLPTSSLCLLRLTCKAVESSTFIAFSREFFAKKQFMLTEFSLKCLIDISEHPTLGPSLNHLIIGTDRYSLSRSHITGSGSVEDQVRFYDNLDAQQELLNTGRASALLAQALRNLRGLQTIDIRDFNSSTRWRDGGASWASYGATHGGLYDAGMVLGPTYYNDDNFVDRAFKVVLVALAESGAKVPNIELVLKDRGWGLTSRVFTVRPWLAPTLQPVLAGLQKLHLAVHLYDQGADPRTHSYPSADPETSDPFNAELRNFLTLTPNLTWLRINFQKSAIPATTKFLTWLSRPVALHNSPVVHYNPPPISLPLTQLDFGVMRVTPALLMAAIVKFSATLKTINLWDITLIGTSSDWDDKTNLWKKLFKALARSSLNLQSLMVGRLRQATPDGLDSAVVNFGKFPHGAPVQHTKCTSSAMQYLEKLADEVAVVFPEPLPGAGSDEDDEGTGDVDEDSDASEEDD